MATVLPNSNTQGRLTSTTSIPAAKKPDEDEKAKAKAANPLLTSYNQPKPVETVKPTDTSKPSSSFLAESSQPKTVPGSLLKPNSTFSGGLTPPAKTTFAEKYPLTEAFINPKRSPLMGEYNKEGANRATAALEGTGSRLNPNGSFFGKLAGTATAKPTTAANATAPSAPTTPTSTAKTADEKFSDTMARLNEKKKADNEAYKAALPSENAKLDAMYQRAVARSGPYNQTGGGGTSDRADRATLTQRLRSYSDPNSELRQFYDNLERLKKQGVPKPPVQEPKKEEPATGTTPPPAPTTPPPAPTTPPPAPTTLVPATDVLPVPFPKGGRGSITAGTPAPAPATTTTTVGTAKPTSPLLTAFTEEEKKQKQQAANVTARALSRAGVK